MSPQGPNQNTVTTITGVNGQTILDVRQNEYMVVQPDGSFESYTHYRYITLVDGSNWTPQMMFQKPEKFSIGVCSICRKRSLFRRRTHGLVMLTRARLCICGQLCCPKHRTLSGKHWRCPSCARKYRLKNLIKPLFFMKIEE